MNIEKKYIMIGSTFFNGRYVDYLDENYTSTSEEEKTKTGKVLNLNIG
jgi:hypothetical protein